MFSRQQIWSFTLSGYIYLHKITSLETSPALEWPMIFTKSTWLEVPTFDLQQCPKALYYLHLPGFMGFVSVQLIIIANHFHLQYMHGRGCTCLSAKNNIYKCFKQIYANHITVYILKSWESKFQICVYGAIATLCTNACCACAPWLIMELSIGAIVCSGNIFSKYLGRNVHALGGWWFKTTYTLQDLCKSRMNRPFYLTVESSNLAPWNLRMGSCCKDLLKMFHCYNGK